MFVEGVLLVKALVAITKSWKRLDVMVESWG